MLEVNSQLIIGWTIAVSCMFVLALISNGVKFLRNFFFRGIIGVSTILILDYIFAGYNISVGVNWFTSLVASLLGVPGIAVMYCLSFFIR